MLKKIRSFLRRTPSGVSEQPHLPYTNRELAVDGHPLDRFFNQSGDIEWVAVRADRKTVVSTWRELMGTKRVRKNVAEERLLLNDPGNHWGVYRISGSPWTHLTFLHGCVGSLGDRQVRELSSRTGSQAFLVYGRNDYDKARGLACIRYESGEPREALLVGADEDQDVLLDHLGLDEDEIVDLDFDFDFDSGRETAAAFLAEHGLADRDVIGALERMDLLIG